MAQTLTPEIIGAAIEGLETRKTRIDQQISELRSMLDGGGTQATPASPSTAAQTKRKFSPAALKRMREAQQRRWAKVRGEAEPASSPAAPAPAKKKRHLSAQGRRNIQEALRKRWAQKRAEAAVPTTTAKKSAPTRKKSAKAGKRGAGRKAATPATPAGE